MGFLNQRHQQNVPRHFWARRIFAPLIRSRSYPQLLTPPKCCSLHNSALHTARPPSTVTNSQMALASSENNSSQRKQSLFSDIVQAQLALWTLVFTVFYSYAWQQHRKKFLVSLFVVVPPVLVICCTLSSLLTAIVILGRFFSSPLRFQDILKMNEEGDENDGSAGGFGSVGGSGGSGGGIRRRTVSGTSCHSCGGLVGRALSMSCEELPKPMCRKHSTSNGSTLSLYASASGGNGNGCVGMAGYAQPVVNYGSTSNGTIPASFTLFARSDSIGGQSVSTGGGGQRLTHQFSHYPSEGIVETLDR